MWLKRIASRSNALLLLVITSVIAADGGIIHVHGMLQESTCWLDVEDEALTPSDGQTAQSDLEQGEQAKAKQALTLRLQDCPYSIRKTNDPFWQRHAPSIRVAFYAPANPLDPELIRVEGTDAIGLHLFNERHQTLPPQFENLRIPLIPGSNVLRWEAMEERTTLPLTPGPWKVSGRLQVSYD